MTVVDDAEKLVARMSRAEKAQLMQTIARDLGDAIPGIERTPGISVAQRRGSGQRLVVCAAPSRRDRP